MTLPVNDRISQVYITDGTTKRFDFTFKLFAQGDNSGVMVRKKITLGFDEIDKTLYSVVANPDGQGGYILFTTAPAAGQYLYILGDTPANQLLSLTNYGNFNANSLERALDKIIAILQERQGQISQEQQGRILADIYYDDLAKVREQDLKNYIDSIVGAITGQPFPGITDEKISVQLQFSGAVARTQRDKNSQYLELRDFCRMNGSDETAGFLAWIAALKLSGKAGWFNEGNCIVSGNIAIDLADQNGNLTIIGAGLNRSKLVIVNTVTEPAFKIYDSNGHINADLFYLTFRDWGIATHVNGTGVMLASRDFSDAINASVFDQFACWNSSTGANAVACEINYVVQSHFNITCNTGSSGQGGAAIRIRQMQFCTLRGSGGNSNISLHFTAGYNFANEIQAFDCEEVNKCIVIDNAQTARNTFTAPQLVWKTGGCGIDATYGYFNLVINPNFGLPTNKVFGTVGIAIFGNEFSCGTLSVPGLHLRSIITEDIVQQLTPGTNRAAVQQFNAANGVRRWQVRQDNTAESGGNSGSNLNITAYDDSGNVLLDLASFNRASGITTIPRASLTGVGFFGAPIATSPPVITGSRGGNAALTSLLQQLAGLGLITNSTTA